MRYLRDSDYKYKISEDDLTTLVEEDSNPDLSILDSEIKAQEVISLYLRKRYDLNALYKSYPTYQHGQTYFSGDTVWFTSGDNFSALLYSPVSATTSLPGSFDWMMVEPRYPLIVDWLVTISLYKLHERISPENIPVHRTNSYQEVMMFLKNIQCEKLSPDFPELEDRTYNIYITGKPDSGIGLYY